MIFVASIVVIAVAGLCFAGTPEIAAGSSPCPEIVTRRFWVLVNGKGGQVWASEQAYF